MDPKDAKPPHDADVIIARVLARFHQHQVPRTGTTRATLVVDADVACLKQALTGGNFRVLGPHEAMDDHDTRKMLLAHRMIVTTHTTDYLDDAPVLDYGIIGLEALPIIDPAEDFKDNATAQMISKAISEFDLISERSGFVILLRADGRHVFRRIGSDRYRHYSS